MDLERRKRFLINAAYYGVVIAIVYVIFHYALFWLMPFVVGFGVAFLLKPVINVVSDVTHIKRKPVAALTVFLFYGTIGVGIAYGLFSLIFSIKELFYQLPQMYMESLEPAIMALFDEIERQISRLDPAWTAGLQEIGNNVVGQLTQIVTGLSKSVIGWISSAATSVPVFFVSVMFALISSFFIAMDYYRITTFIVNQFNAKNKGIIFDIKDYIVGTVFKMISSYAFIMFITFLELAIGFTVLRIENALGMAAVIALLDVLPILGTGGVVIPWIIIEFLTKDYPLAFGLLCVYFVVTLVRNMLEPKIVGNRVGLPPLVVLICMFVGVKLFGALGIVIMPFMAIVVKNLNDSGKIHVFNSAQGTDGAEDGAWRKGERAE